MDWGLCLATFGGPRETTVPFSNLTQDWYERAFSDPYGIEAYLRQMSGGRVGTTWRVFPPVELMPIEDKLALDRQGHGALAQGLRTAARAKGIPVDRVVHFLWVFNDWQSSSGLTLTSDDSVLGAFDFTVQNACHEIMHQYGVSRHADDYDEDGKLREYGDQFCIMGDGRRARSFQNSGLYELENDRTHATCGPGLCAPYLVEAGWASLGDHVQQVGWDWLEGEQTIVLSANFGAPPPGQRRTIGLAFGSASSGESAQPQQWIEYRTPLDDPPRTPSFAVPPSHHRGFDRRIDTRVWDDTTDLPEEGGLIVHEVRDEGARHAIFLSAVPATVGETIRFRGLPEQRGLQVKKVDLQSYPPTVELSAVSR